MTETPVSDLPLVIIAAVARNGVIGGGNALLWRLPSDLKRFKALTWGKPMIMGRKTYESIGKPLLGRETIVVTRDQGWRPAGVHVAHSLGEAIELAKACAATLGASEIVIAGGADVYQQTMGMAQRLEITHVDLAPAGDAHFPDIDAAKWREVSRESGSRGAGDGADYVFSVYEPKRNTPSAVENPAKGA